MIKPQWQAALMLSYIKSLDGSTRAPNSKKSISFVIPQLGLEAETFFLVQHLGEGFVDLLVRFNHLYAQGLCVFEAFDPFDSFYSIIYSIELLQETL